MAAPVHDYHRAVDRAPNDDLNVFCRQIRERSREHQEAMQAATEHGWSSIAVGILRQELDSMVRVIYLLTQPPEIRTDLVTDSVSGKRWTIPAGKGKTKPVTDRDMVEHAHHLHGWTRNVYEFGCRFIHLSSAHDYLARDPFQALPLEDREIIIRYLNKYHGHRVRQVSLSSSFNDIIVYAPSVLEKIATNLEYDLRSLEGQ